MLSHISTTAQGAFIGMENVDSRNDSAGGNPPKSNRVGLAES
jgi:hypothetical protein